MVTLAALPLGLVVCLVLAGLILKKRWLVAAGLVALYLTSIPFVGNGLVGILESQYPRIEVADCPPADAVVVLGGLVSDSRGTVESVEWSEAVDRFQNGFYLVRAGKAPVLVVSGGSMSWVREGYTEGDAMRETAIQRGLDKESVQVVRGVLNTADEAEKITALARENGWDRLVLV
ncbi:MAG: YdcF family protein, partial [bacterium]|nr:YdcF family protein [bacterium]